MAGPYDATTELLEDRPELDAVLKRIISLDREGPWSFDDLDCDSGTFGEIVSREFVESVDDGYRLVDREATRAAVAGEDYGSSDDEAESAASDATSTITLPNIPDRLRQRPSLTNRNRSFVYSLVVSFVFLFVMRTVNFQNVFRDSNVVLTGNDPYHFRHWVDQLLAESPGIFAFGRISEMVGDDPLTYTIGWWLTLLFEGNPETSGFVLAWIPVVSTILIGIGIAWIALVVTRDERIAVLSVLFLAITPGHALYTGLGFYDHHALDHVWLIWMAASLIWLAHDREQHPETHLQRPKTWAVTGGFGVACAAAMMSWEGAPILLLGVGLYAVTNAASQLRTSESPLVSNLPLVGGLGIASLISLLLHSVFGWQESVVAYAPGLVLAGTISVVGLAELIARRDGKPWWVLASTGLVGGFGFASVRLLAPGLYNQFLDRFTRKLLGRSGIAETKGLFAIELGPEFGPLRYFGLLLLVIIPALFLVTRRCVESHEPKWLVIAGYAWSFLGLSVIQVRFGAELALFGSLLGATGLLWTLSKVGLCRPLACFETREPITLRMRRGVTINQAVYVSFIIVMIVAVGLVYTAGSLSSLSTTDAEYDAATWIAADSGPDDGFVLTKWDRSRMYNYFSWGGGDRYIYERGIYSPFLASQNPDQWYEKIQSRASKELTEFDAVDYIVIDDTQIASGFRGEQRKAWINAVGHYQLVYVTEFGTVSVFKPVEGATIRGNATPETTVSVSTELERHGVNMTYTRETTSAANGTYSVRVAYPGEYSLSAGSTLNVSEADVTEGRVVEDS